MPVNNFSCWMCHQKDKLQIKEVFSIDELEEIWAQGGNFLKQYTKQTKFYLIRCSNCGLEFFNPAIKVEPIFYSNPIFSNYYYFSWDIKTVLKKVLNANISSLLDYGCGKGELLKMLPEEWIKVGVDFNAPEQDSLPNLSFFAKDLIKFEDKSKFDCVVCAQVLEHLDNTRGHLEKMISLMKRGGYLFLSVPNQEGILNLIENKGKSLDFPPHHLTRWNKKSLLKVSEIFNLELVDFIEEPLGFTHFKWAMNSFISSRYNKGFIQRVLRRFLILSQDAKLPLFYHKFKKKVRGHSILAIFKKKRDE